VITKLIQKMNILYLFILGVNNVEFLSWIFFNLNTLKSALIIYLIKEMINRLKVFLLFLLSQLKFLVSKFGTMFWTANS
jgi:hypothetical protein